MTYAGVEDKLFCNARVSRGMHAAKRAELELKSPRDVGATDMPRETRALQTVDTPEAAPYNPNQ
jgi:hypothetical protein